MAIKMYDKAVKLNPTYAIAFCRLSMAHAWMYWFYIDTSKENIDLAWKTVHKAQELDRDLPEVHQALGRYHYFGGLEYNRALKHFAIARKNQPNNSDILSFIGFILRRQANFEEAFVNIRKASELDPLNSNLAREVAVTLVGLRRYEVMSGLSHWHLMMRGLIVKWPAYT